MARKVYSAVGINLAGGSASTTPEFGPGDTVMADSGLYIYLQANGTVAEGYAVKYAEGTWDADTITTAESGTTQTAIAINVTSGGLADNYWGWFWRGLGKEYAYVKDSASADTQMMTTTTAGQVGDTTDGTDPIHDLFTVGAAAGAALSLVRSGRLLAVNTTVTN